MARALDPLSPEQLLADSRWLRSLARGLAGESGADDLVSETWLTAARRPPRFWDNLRPWLRTVARNLSLRERDREARRREREAIAARPEGQPSTVDLVARATLRRSVVDAVLELPEPYRTTILLRFFEELPPREVARRLGVPVATVRTRIARGLEQLRGRLDDERGPRQAWIALLVPAKGLLGTLGLTGAIVMATKAKVAGAAGVVLLLGALGWWQWSRFSPPAEGPAAPASSEDVARAAAAPASAPVAANPNPASRAIRPQPYSEAAEKGFAIIGTVVDDRNDRPVEGVAAKIMAWTPKPESVATDTATDRDGKFAAPVHQKNRIRGVTFYSPEYAPLVLDHLENDIRGALGDALDVGTLRLQRGARVSGKVVSAETKEPIGDAQLFVSPRGYPVTQPLLGEARPVGRSGADGTFTLSERVPPPPPRWDWEAILTAVTPDGIGWTILTVVKDRETLDGIEVAVARGAAARVTVVDEAEKPVEGVRVFAIPRFAPLGPPRHFGAQYAYGVDRPELGDHFAKRTGADGVVAFRGLPMGRTDERFKQYYSSDGAYDFSAYHKDYVASVPASIDVDPAAEIAPRSSSCAAGSAPSTDTSQTSRARRSKGRASRTAASRRLPRRTATEPIGSRAGILPTAGSGSSSSRRATRELWRKVDLSTKAEEVVADFVLLKATPIKGRVIDQDGKPVPGAYVDLLDGKTDESRRQLRPDGDGKLDAEGRFVFSDATAGAWKMRVFGPDPYEDWIPPRERIVQGGDQNVEVVLRRSTGRASLEAEIVAAGTGAPIDPAECPPSHGEPRDVLGRPHRRGADADVGRPRDRREAAAREVGARSSASPTEAVRPASSRSSPRTRS